MGAVSKGSRSHRGDNKSNSKDYKTNELKHKMLKSSKKSLEELTHYFEN
jgi:hypothetical protein